ncbi:MAG: VCBS repeat-containing protein [Actinomycetota bacterium]
MLDYPVFEIAAADFNENGTKDLALTRHHSVVMFKGRGDGTFRQAGRFSVGSLPSKLLVADLNRDGDKDLVTSNFDSDNVSVLIGRGDATFRRRVNYRAGDGASGVDVGKLNGDRKPDLAVTNLFDDDVSIRLGRGDGTFGPKRDRGAAQNPRDVAIARLNRDRERDLAVAGFRQVAILKGRGDGTFRRGRDVLIGLLDSEVIATRINRDRANDLVFSDVSNNWSVYVARGRGNGTFKAPSAYGFDSAPTKIALADLVGGPRKDLIVETIGYPGGGGNNPGFLYVLRGRRGGFTQQIAQPLDGRGGRFAIADLNGDGTRDVAALTHTPVPKIEIFLNH